MVDDGDFGRWYAEVTPERVRDAIESSFSEADRRVGEAVAAKPNRTFDNTLRPLNDAAIAVWTGWGKAGFLTNAHPDPAVRDAAQDGDARVNRWGTELFQRDDVYAAATEYAETEEAQQLDEPRARVLALLVQSLRRAGHGRPPDVRAEIAELHRRISELGVAFNAALVDWDETLELGPDDLDGLQDDFIARLPEGEQAGSRRISIAFGDVHDFLAQSTRRDLRERVLKRWLSRGGDENVERLVEVMRLRRRLAELLGYPSWADYANETRMSGSREGANAFVASLIPPLRRVATDELRQMAQLLNGESHEIETWDWMHLHYVQSRRLGLNHEALSAHLPLDQVLDGIFALVRETFGVRIEEVPEVSGWHPDVRRVVLYDDETGEQLSDVYLDLIYRNGKAPGAFQAELRPRVGERPSTKIVLANIATPAEGSAPLLTVEDVRTLFHEFGHALEFSCARSDLLQLDWSWVELDFVEAPSQIMENWVLQPDILARFARHHETGSRAPRELLEAVQATDRLNVALHTLWIFVYRTLVDAAFHGPEPADPEQAYRGAIAAIGLPFPEGTMQPASFAHSVLNYDAGFYGYLWARVYGDDMFSVFKREGLTSRDVGMRYRREVLEPSWLRPGAERLRRFLGREPSNAAFLESIGIAATRGA